MPGVSDVKVLKKGPGNRVVRQMTIGPPTTTSIDRFALTEEITWDDVAHVVDFRIMEHPTHTGDVYNRVEVKENGEIWLTFEMDWKFKGEGPDPLAAMTMEAPVKKSVDYIERLYAQQQI